MMVLRFWREMQQMIRHHMKQMKVVDLQPLYRYKYEYVYTRVY